MPPKESQLNPNIYYQPQGRPFIPEPKYAIPEALSQAEVGRQAEAAKQGAAEFIPIASQKEVGPRKAKELVAKKVARLMNRRVPLDAMEGLRRTPEQVQVIGDYRTHSYVIFNQWNQPHVGPGSTRNDFRVQPQFLEVLPNPRKIWDQMDFIDAEDEKKGIGGWKKKRGEMQNLKGDGGQLSIGNAYVGNDQTKHHIMAVDVSTQGFRGVFSQLDKQVEENIVAIKMAKFPKEKEKVVYFISQRFLDAETRCLWMEREALAVAQCLEEVRWMVVTSCAAVIIFTCQLALLGMREEVCFSETSVRKALEDAGEEMTEELCFLETSVRKALEDAGEEMIEELCFLEMSVRKALEDAGKDEIEGSPALTGRSAAEFLEIPNQAEGGDIPDNDIPDDNIPGDDTQDDDTASDDRTASVDPSEPDSDPAVALDREADLL